MNITQWLEDTAAATRPRQPNPIVQQSESLAVPAAATNPVIRPSKNGLRVRRRLGADSSILTPENTPPEVSHKKSKKAKTVDRRSHSATSDSGKCSSPRPSSGAIGTTDSEPYRRKKRRKTRADRYELKPVRSPHTNADPSHRRGRAKKKEKRGHKEKKKVIKGNPAAAVVHNFNAPNVRRERLTVSICCTEELSLSSLTSSAAACT